MDLTSKILGQYHILEQLGRGPLKDRLGQPMDLSQAAHFVEQIAAALDHAHGRGILHTEGYTGLATWAARSRLVRSPGCGCTIGMGPSGSGCPPGWTPITTWLQLPLRGWGCML